MQSIKQSSLYPISLDEIKSKILKKSGKRKRSMNQQLDFFVNQEQSNVQEITNEFHEKIIRIDGEIPVDLPVKDQDRYLFISYDQSFLTHGLHKYPAKFFPELPRWLIQRYSQNGDFILDPFSGSGTTNLEALLMHRNSVGIDVEPFSRYLSTVKVTPIEKEELISSQESLLETVLHYHTSTMKKWDIPDFPYRDIPEERHV